LHLQLKRQCADCHAAAASSTSPQENLLPVAAACKPCHESRVIRAARATPLTHFSHAQHLRLGNIAPVIAGAIDQRHICPIRVTFGLISMQRTPAWRAIEESIRQIM
jgi:hypothetical protein